MIKITMTDDHPLVMAGLKSFLHSQPGIEVIGMYESGESLLKGLEQQLPDVILLDLQLSGDPQGKDLIKIIKESYPEVHILILTSNDNVYNIQTMLNAGASGYILKNIEQKMLVEAIEKINKNETFLSSEVKDILINTMRKDNKSGGKEMLTTREIEILQLIAEEYTSQEIGKRLCLSYRTVETYRLGIMQKLGVKNMVGMTKKAILLGIV